MATDDQQGSYLAQPTSVPLKHIRPPSEQDFANATWMKAGPEVRKIVTRVLKFDEFKDLGGMSYEVRWRRKTAPMMTPDQPLYASCAITPQDTLWLAKEREDPDFPRYCLDLHWRHFADLRDGFEPGEDRTDNPETRGAMYVHEDILEQHVHHALSGLYVESDTVKRSHFDYSGYAKTVRRYGQWNRGVTVVARQLDMFMGRESEG